jgi:hypothetical protein
MQPKIDAALGKTNRDPSYPGCFDRSKWAGLTTTYIGWFAERIEEGWW